MVSLSETAKNIEETETGYSYVKLPTEEFKFVLQQFGRVVNDNKLTLKKMGSLLKQIALEISELKNPDIFIEEKRKK